MAPLSGYWRGIIALAAMVGVAVCIGLGFLWATLFMTVPGSVSVLDRAATGQDTLADRHSTKGSARLDAARFLATYENTSYYAAPGAAGADDYCLIAEPAPMDTYREACAKMVDGRDWLALLSDPDGRNVILVPDQFDAPAIEEEGWVALHRNLMVQPLPPCLARSVC